MLLYSFLCTNFYTFLPCHLFKVEYRVNLLKRINRLNYSIPNPVITFVVIFLRSLRWWQRYLEVLIISTKLVFIRQSLIGIKPIVR
jgi:hypothetical protein